MGPKRGGGVWVFDEEQLQRAKEELVEFCQAPTAARYDAQREAKLHRTTRLREAKSARRRHVDVRNTWTRSPSRVAVVTTALMAICGAVALVTQMGSAQSDLASSVIEALLYTSRQFGYGLASTLEAGEVWRLVTPIFLHFGMLHLLFNMMWLYRLGFQIEGARGSTRFLVLVLAIAVVSNGVQFFFGSPFFGGMSGVVYGLLGYIWIQARTLPTPDLHIDQQTVLFMMAWLVLCFSGMMGPVANGAHVGGLVCGVVMGARPWVSRTLGRRLP